MSLLSNSDFSEIRSAIRSVTDTFMVTPIKFFIVKDSISKWQEDMPDKKYYEIELEALHEEKKDDIDSDEQGNLDKHDLSLTFNLDYLEEKGLITADYNHIFNQAKDYVEVKGILYKIKDIHFDGPLSEKNVLLIVNADKITYSNLGSNSVKITNGNVI